MTPSFSISSRPTWLATALFASTLGLASCGNSSTSEQTTETTATTEAAAADTAATAGAKPVKPAGPAPAWAPNIAPEMQTVIEKLAALQGPTPPETLTPAEVRKAPSATDATMAVMKDFGIPTPPSPLDTMSREVAPGVKARIYVPKGATGPLPVVVYYHGGAGLLPTSTRMTHRCGPWPRKPTLFLFRWLTGRPRKTSFPRRITTRLRPISGC
ncbi:hypothetical protein [Hymenobacter cellulosilyticus]|uniref:Alpha/beta hydrolase fold-3 domain-containing protein n=1 Tax=Hymenobacter cellulosilyticus TaxID=2932248 RepID=A0A8T9Q6J0_9BACT|nr:hypothetical protein [Hymenobacter cellulosilyticus]UOQ73177.1 hypothetical protein MUN79_04175 [Hymenobacter cellulosilyticus]